MRMKRFLIALLIIITLGLCVVCVIQWRREAVLRARIQEVTTQLVSENKLRTEAEERAVRYESEVERLTKLRAETEAALLVATEEVRSRTADQVGRGYSIAILMNEIMAHGGEANAYKELAGKGADAIRQRNAEVLEQNAAIERQNSQLKQLTIERDDAITKLNSRTREFNELVEKYNRLARER